MIAVFLKYYLFLLLLLNPVGLVSKNNAYPADSGDVRKVFDTIMVTSDRLQSESVYKFMPLHLISREKIERSNSLQISDVLHYSPGIFIKDYGGLGGLKTVSIRGSSTQQTTVLLDGIKLNSSQSGIIDFSSIPASMINEIEIIRGGASCIYGGNAIGGVINLLTDEFGDISNIQGRLNIGSFGEFGSSAKIYIPGTNEKYSASFDYISTKGDYPYPVEHYGSNSIEKRVNGDFKNFSFSVAGSKLFNGWSLKSHVLGRLSDRGTPGPVLSGIEEGSLSRLTEKEVLFSNKLFVEDLPDFFFTLFGRINKIKYTNPDLPAENKSGTENDYTNRDATFAIRWKPNIYSISSDISFEYSYTDLRGDMLDPVLSSFVSRNLLALGIRLEHETSISSYTTLHVFGGLRTDFLSDAGSAVSPLAGAMFGFDSIPLTLRASISYNFRPPSFNEMYYLNFGTSDLKPERSVSCNLGATIRFFNLINLNLEGFIISTKDQIVAVPKSPISWSARNLDEVVTMGCEINLNFNIIEGLINSNLSYTLQSATDKSPGSVTIDKEIVYIPREVLSGQIEFNIKNSALGFDLNHSSYRYSLPDNTYSSMLKSYTTIDFYLSERISISKKVFTFRLECRNAFDVTYSIIRNFPMPGRSLRGTLNFNI